MPLRKNISTEESKKLKELALRISYLISVECGPPQAEYVGGKRREHTTMFGFNGPKAREIIEDKIWEYLLKD